MGDESKDDILDVIFGVEHDQAMEDAYHPDSDLDSPMDTADDGKTSLKGLEEQRKQLEKENEERKAKLRKLKEEEKAAKQALEKEYGKKDEKRTPKKGDKRKSPRHDADLSLSADEGDEFKGGGEFDVRSETGGSSDEDSDYSEGSRREKKKKRRDRRDISPIRPPEHTEPERPDKRDTLAEQGEEEEPEPKKDQSAKLKYIFRGARFFLVKSNNHENVALAKAKGVWASPPPNEARFNSAFKENPNVILVFSVKESGRFQGYARIAAESDKEHAPVRWVLPPAMSQRALSGIFKLDWINRKEVPFPKTSHLFNPYNENRPVKIGRDGQEVEPHVGEALCRLYPPDDNVDLRAIALKAKRSIKRYIERERFGKHTASSRDNNHQSQNQHVPRRRRAEDFGRGNSAKRGRSDFGQHHGHQQGHQQGHQHQQQPRDNYYGGGREQPRDRSPRYTRNREEHRGGNGQPHHQGVRRETYLNGSYKDYLREITRGGPPPMIPPGFPPPPPGWGGDHHAAQASYPYERRDYQQPDYPRPRQTDKRSYERDVDEFLRWTSTGGMRERRGGGPERGGPERDPRERERERHRERR